MPQGGEGRAPGAEPLRAPPPLGGQLSSAGTAQIYRQKVTQLTASTRRAEAAHWRILCRPSTFWLLLLARGVM